MQWLVMMLGAFSITGNIMIGRFLSVWGDFSIHIANRVKEMGGTIDGIRTSCSSTV